MSARNDQAEALHLRAYHAINVLKLVALTSETKRVLLDIETALEFRPELREKLRQNVRHMTGWLEQQDPTSEVLDHLALELEETSSGLPDLAFDRSEAGKGVQA